MIRKIHFSLVCCVIIFLLSTAIAQAAVDKVICVPWQGDINSYHTTVSGHNLEIKGVNGWLVEKVYNFSCTEQTLVQVCRQYLWHRSVTDI